ncbi:hypothetical protein RLPCCGM1_p0025 [Rhizobium leguminosarum bv. phaseoli CCGM1]|nr:hypothetical protein RLPCCGM1_p0025 [Rhizobium leguminosarum bv. phaseoli CCGM1]
MFAVVAVNVQRYLDEDLPRFHVGTAFWAAPRRCPQLTFF